MFFQFILQNMVVTALKIRHLLRNFSSRIRWCHWFSILGQIWANFWPNIDFGQKSILDQKNQNWCLVSINYRISQGCQKNSLGWFWAQIGPILAENRFWTKKNTKIGQKCEIDVWCQLTIEFPRDAKKLVLSDFGPKLARFWPKINFVQIKHQNWSKMQNWCLVSINYRISYWFQKK